MTLADVSATLDRQEIPHAVIGAFVLAVYGVVRASDDIDIFATDRRCLVSSTWNGLTNAHAKVDIRHGDADDPLAGVVRIELPEPPRIDVVVGRGAWQEDVLSRARRIPLLGASIPIALPADLVLLKLYAGGPQDAWDIDQLLDAMPEVESEASARLHVLPAECRTLWQRILDSRSGH